MQLSQANGLTAGAEQEWAGIRPLLRRSARQPQVTTPVQLHSCPNSKPRRPRMVFIIVGVCRCFFLPIQRRPIPEKYLSSSIAATKAAAAAAIRNVDTSHAAIRHYEESEYRPVPIRRSSPLSGIFFCIRRPMRASRNYQTDQTDQTDRSDRSDQADRSDLFSRVT